MSCQNNDEKVSKTRRRVCQKHDEFAQYTMSVEKNLQNVELPRRQDTHDTATTTTSLADDKFSAQLTPTKISPTSVQTGCAGRVR